MANSRATCCRMATTLPAKPLPRRYASRSSAGEQQEKFLFYRGVSAAPLPLSAAQNPDGMLVVKTLSQDEIPAIILSERRGERVGYRFAGALTDETALAPPVLTGSADALRGDLGRDSRRSGSLSRRSTCHGGDLAGLLVR